MLQRVTSPEDIQWLEDWELTKIISEDGEAKEKLFKYLSKISQSYVSDYVANFPLVCENSASLYSRSSGTATTPTDGSIVQNG